MWPTGALVGAGGATAYYNGVDVTGTVRTLLMGGQLRDMPSWHTSPSNRELDSLYKLVIFLDVARMSLLACKYA